MGCVMECGGLKGLLEVVATSISNNHGTLWLPFRTLSCGFLCSLQWLGVEFTEGVQKSASVASIPDSAHRELGLSKAFKYLLCQ